MTFTAFEASQQSSEPIELYTFTIGSAVRRVTSAEDSIVEGADTFTATTIERSSVNGGGRDSRKESVVLIVPGTDLTAQQFTTSVPGATATVRIERIQRSDGPSYEVIRIFEGRIVSVAFTKAGRVAKMKLEPLASAQSRPMPRFTYQGLCNHVLYDGLCKVSDSISANRLTSAAVTGEADNTITVSGAGLKGNGYYTGGWVELPGAADRRLILEQTGDLLILMLPFGSSPVGGTVDVLAGCDHSIATCKTKFDNVINFGGFAFVPKKNVFKTGIRI